MKSVSGAKDAASMPKSGGSKGASIASPGHQSVTGNVSKVGSTISLKGNSSRSAGSKR